MMPAAVACQALAQDNGARVRLLGFFRATDRWGAPHLARFSRDVGYHCSSPLTLDSSDALSGQQRWFLPTRPSRGLLQLLKKLFAFTRGEEAVGLKPMLACVQVVVTAFKRVKGGVRAALQYHAALDHQDLIGPADGREAVGDHKGGAPLHQVAEAILNHGLRFGVERRGRLIENKNARVGQNRARNRKALALPTRQLDPALAHNGVVALRKPQGEFVNPGNGTSGEKLLLRRIGPREDDVLPDGAVEEKGFL